MQAWNGLARRHLRQRHVSRSDPETAALLFDQEQVLVVTSDQDALIDRAAVPSILDALAIDTITSIGGELSDLELGHPVCTGANRDADATGGLSGAAAGGSG